MNNVFPDDESCPDCGGFIFRPGPRGGLSQNIECVGCGSRFNITRWNPDTDVVFVVEEKTVTSLGPRGFVWAQRIDNHGDWREDMFPKVLQ